VRSFCVGLVLMVLSVAMLQDLGLRIPGQVVEVARAVAAFGIAGYVVVLGLSLMCHSCGTSQGRQRLPGASPKASPRGALEHAELRFGYQDKHVRRGARAADALKLRAGVWPARARWRP